MAKAAPMQMVAAPTAGRAAESDTFGEDKEAEASETAVTVRSNFSDTALWVAVLDVGEDGTAEVSLKMPENLTAWKARAWVLAPGTMVGGATTELTTSKKLLVRLQTPRFLTEKDEVVLSANIHNYLDHAEEVKATLEMEGDSLALVDAEPRQVRVEPGGEVRVDWKARAVREGEAVVRVKAIGATASDAMELRFPVQVHGMAKTNSLSTALRPEDSEKSVAVTVPAERRPTDSRLEIRFSPTLAGAMVDALPFLADYPYGCTEQTLNRFVPTVITQRILENQGIDLEAVRDKRTNLNAQEIGDPAKRATQWQHWKRNPVFDRATVDDMVREGLRALTAMQLSDGGWGWFSGSGEHSAPHTTAVVVRGLLIAKANGVEVNAALLENGLDWLSTYQAEQIAELKSPKSSRNHREQADNTDALVYGVLAEAKRDNADMRAFLYRDRNDLSVYGKAITALAFHRLGHNEERDMLIRNIRQFLREDEENQTAWLELGNGGFWWRWYGSEFEAQATFLRLLAATDPKGETASRLAKYLINNRKHATYWNSTRDTAMCIEALAEFLTASGESAPDLDVEILVDGKVRRSVKITKDNLFTFDGTLVLEGDEVTTGEHTITFRKKGTGPLYTNTYLTVFSLEDPITKAGLEIKVERRFYKLEPEDKEIAVRGGRGQAVTQKVEKFRRVPLESGASLASGDLVEVELEIESKNDYEYILFEDMKAAGMEAVEVRSGFNGNDMGAYVEFRDNRVALFVRQLARGKHSVAYRLRAEIPGTFSALPAKANGMYAPELRANSNEMKIGIQGP